MNRSLKNIWLNKGLILEGIQNSLFIKSDVEKIAQARMSICEECPLIDRTGDKCMLPGTQPCCSECGCKLSFKTRSLASECPHPDGPKWESIVEQKEQDKLYKDLNYNPDDTESTQ